MGCKDCLKYPGCPLLSNFNMDTDCGCIDFVNKNYENVGTSAGSLTIPSTDLSTKSLTKRYVFVDPSGSFEEGKGKTGIAVLDGSDWKTLKVESVVAHKYKSRYEYWNDLIFKIGDYKPDIVVIESYIIRSFGFLIGKMPETIQFIGALTHFLDGADIKWITQRPTEAKARYKDEDLLTKIPGLEKRGNLYYLNGNRINDHIRDALKHLLYYKTFKEVKHGKP